MKPPKASSPRVEFAGSRNRGGRPRSAEQKSSVSTWLPTAAHDRLIAVASAKETSVSEIVRVIILNVINVQASR